MDPKKWLEGIVKVDDLIKVDWDTVKVSQTGNIFIENLNVTVNTPPETRDKYQTKVTTIRGASGGITPEMKKEIADEVSRRLMPIIGILTGVSKSAQMEVVGSTLVNLTYDAVKKIIK